MKIKSKIKKMLMIIMTLAFVFLGITYCACMFIPEFTIGFPGLRLSLAQIVSGNWLIALIEAILIICIWHTAKLKTLILVMISNALNIWIIQFFIATTGHNIVGSSDQLKVVVLLIIIIYILAFIFSVLLISIFIYYIFDRRKKYNEIILISFIINIIGSCISFAMVLPSTHLGFVTNLNQVENEQRLKSDNFGLYDLNNTNIYYNLNKKTIENLPVSFLCAEGKYNQYSHSSLLDLRENKEWELILDKYADDYFTIKHKKSKSKYGLAIKEFRLSICEIIILNNDEMIINLSGRIYLINLKNKVIEYLFDGSSISIGSLP